LKLLDSLSGFISKGYEGVKGGLARDQAAYRDTLGALSALSGNYMDLFKATNLSARDKADIKLAALKEGYDYDEKTGKYTPFAPTGNLDLGDTTDRIALRDKYQKMFSSTPSLTMRQRIADDYKKATGRTLFPEGIQDKGTVSGVQGTIDTLKMVDQAEEILSRRPDLEQWKLSPGLGLGRGNIADALVNGPLKGMVKDPDLVKLASIMTQLRGAGDRTLIGGRLTGYLLKQLSSAFPSLENSIANNR